MDRRSALFTLGAAAFAAPSWRLRRSSPAQDEYEQWMRDAGVPSISMARIEGDQVTYLSLGVRKAGEQARVAPDTVYAAASLSKLVFAYAFLDLVQQGRLSLDRPVAEYLALPNPADVRARLITARHLLSHSSGWRNWRNTTTDTLTTTFEPGTGWQYSGEGFFFLQRIMEQVTGQSMAQVCRERVFEPLGMTRSSMASLESLEAYQATGHNTEGVPRASFGRATLIELRKRMSERGTTLDAARVEDVEAAMQAAEPRLPVLPNFLAPNAAASLLTTAEDFGKFLRHLANPPASGTARAITRDMMTPQVRRNGALQWGLGIGLEEVAGRPVGWQWGDNPGFKNFCCFDPAKRSALVIFTNGDRGARVYERVVRAATGVDHPAFLFV